MDAKVIYPQGHYFMYFLVNKLKKALILLYTCYIRLKSSTYFIIKQACKLK